ncbi:hypothetical protein ABPG72_012420 [Tetrahymena utriculariae]
MLRRVIQDKPQMVGNYKVGDKLGQGASGTVYKGEHVETGQVVAIKLVSTVNIKKENIKSIKKEMHLLKKLKHENIVQYIDFIQTENHYAIILEYIESGSLYGIIKKFGPFQESLVIIFIKQVLRGLEYLHRQGIVHRDIKGANILTTKNNKSGVIKLTDFGVATHLADDDKSSTQCVGTPYWMAPEVIIDSDGHISTSCDIWSLGCTIIELLTGNPPYSYGNPHHALFKMVSDQHPPLPKDVTPQCLDFLMQCFNKEPSQRMDAKNLLHHEWLKINIETEVLEIINSPNPELPEEVLNSIRNHINESQHELDTNSNNKQSASKQDNNQNHLERHSLQEQNYISNKENDKDIKDVQQIQVNYNSTLQNSINQSITSLKNIQIAQQEKRLIGLRLNEPNTCRNQTANQTIDEIGSFAGSIVDNNKPLDSLRNYNFKKKNNGTLNSKKEQKMYQDTQEIVNGLQKTREPKKVEEYMNYLSDIISRFPKAKSYFIKQSGLSLFLDLLDKFSTNFTIIQQVLSFLNQIVENEMYYLETACLFGVVPQILKFTSDFYPKEIRFEVSCFIAQLFTSPSTLQIFIACGGSSALVDLLDVDVSKNKEIIQIGVDMLLMLSEVQFLSYQNLCRMLFKYDICQKLVLIFFGLVEEFIQRGSQDQAADLKLIQKCLDIFLLFAKCEDKQMKINICQDETVQILIETIDSLIQQEENLILNQFLQKIILIFRHLSNEHTLLNKLENFGLIKRVLNLLDIESRKQKTDEVFLDDLLKIINFFQNLSHPRQEHLVLTGALPILTSITSNSAMSFGLRKISLSILCQFVKTSPLTRKKLLEHGGPHIFLCFLQISEECFKQFSFKILDTLASWLVIDLEQIESFFLENLKFFIPSADNNISLLQIIPIIYRIISLSDKIAQVMACQEQFIENLCYLLTDFDDSNVQNTNTPQIKKKILEFLHCILMRSTPQSICYIVEKHDLNKKLHYIIEKSSELEIIILEEISQNLLELYNESKQNCNQSNYQGIQGQMPIQILENKAYKQQQDQLSQQQMQIYKMQQQIQQNNNQNFNGNLISQIPLGVQQNNTNQDQIVANSFLPIEQIGMNLNQQQMFMQYQQQNQIPPNLQQNLIQANVSKQQGANSNNTNMNQQQQQQNQIQINNQIMQQQNVQIFQQNPQNMYGFQNSPSLQINTNNNVISLNQNQFLNQAHNPSNNNNSHNNNNLS